MKQWKFRDDNHQRSRDGQTSESRVEEKSDAILNVASIIIIFKLELERRRTSSTKHIAKREEEVGRRQQKNQIEIIDRSSSLNGTGVGRWVWRVEKYQFFRMKRDVNERAAIDAWKTTDFYGRLCSARSLAVFFSVFASRSEKWSFSGRWQKVNELAANRLVEFSPSHHCPAALMVGRRHQFQWSRWCWAEEDDDDDENKISKSYRKMWEWIIW